MERSTRQTVIAALWEAQGHEALLELLASTPKSRDHELIHALHEQSVDCRRSAPDFAAHLEKVAGWLTEIHAGLRAAESVSSVQDLLRWQLEVPWRQSLELEALLAARAASSDPAKWPWSIERLPGLRAELDQVLSIVRELEGMSTAARLRRMEGEPRLQWPELIPWLSNRAGLDDPASEAFARIHRSLLRWQRMRAPEQEPSRPGSSEVAVLAELVELWYRLDPALDRACASLSAEVVSGQRPLSEALRAIVVGAVEPVRTLHRRAYLLHHLLDERSVPVRRAAMEELAGLVAGSEAQTLGDLQRAIVVQRWAAALVLHWHVLEEPPISLQAAVDALGRCLPKVIDDAPPRVTRDLMVSRARLLGCLSRFRDEHLAEAVRSYELALERLGETAEPRTLGCLRAELAGLLRSRRSRDLTAQDRRIRGLYDDALAELQGTMVLRARAMADYAVYLARPLTGVDEEDGEHALLLAERAVELLSGLPEGVADHPLLRSELGITWSILGNLRLEVGREALDARRDAAIHAYEEGMTAVGGANDLVEGLLSLDLALVVLGAVEGRQDQSLERAREELSRAEARLRPLPVAHARAVVERAMLAVQAAPDDDEVRRQAIRQVEAALSRLPVGADPVVRARVQRQLGDLFLARDGPDDPHRAAEQLAAARTAFIEGGAARLAVEVARDYAESQIRLHADEGNATALTRAEVVLEQAALLAEQRWASRRPTEPTAPLAAMVDGVYGDLAWLRAKLERPPESVLQATCRGKRYRARPGVAELRTRAQRSSMLAPAHFDPLARRAPVAPREGARPPGPAPSPSRLRTGLEAFASANPTAVGLDVTLSQWGTVVTAVDGDGVRYASLPLTRETVRRWVWGDGSRRGWWELRPWAAPDHGEAGDKAWNEAYGRLADDLGRRLLEPALRALGCSVDQRVVLVAPGRLTALPLGSAMLGGKALVERVRGLALVSSLAQLPAGPLPSGKPSRALAVVAEPETTEPSESALEELRDVVRLLVSAGSEVDVLVRGVDAASGASLVPPKALTKGQVRIGGAVPTVEAVLGRVGSVDHVYCRGRDAGGLVLVDELGGAVSLDHAALGSGPRWPLGCSLLVGGGLAPGFRSPEPWALVEALQSVGVGFVVTSTGPVSDALARDFCRSFYLYWALGRGIPEACAAALVKVAGSEPSRQGAFVVAMGPTSVETAGGDPGASP